MIPAFPPLVSDNAVASTRSPWVVRLAGLLLFAMAFSTFLPALRGGYIVDDDIYITQNRTLRSADGFRRIWCEIGAEPDYYTAVYSTFWLEYHLWGLAPLGYHAVNIVLHALVALLLWRLLVRLKVPGAWLAAAVFAVHPVCVESVAWVTERKNTLSLLLALASMLCYLRFEPADVETDCAVPDRRRWQYYSAALFLFAAALLSKTAVATLPAVLLVIYWWKRGSINRRTALPLVPLFVLALSLGAVTIWVETCFNGAQGDDYSYSLIERMLIAGRALCFYAGKLAWPHPLAFFYPRWHIDTHEWSQFLYPCAALLTLIMLWLLRGKFGRGPVAAAMIFAGVLLPALGFINTCYMRFFFVADHLQYQAASALIALTTAAVWIVANRYCRGPLRPIPVVAAALLLATFAVLSWRQCWIYADAISLNQDVLAKNPESWVAHSNYGVALIDVGKYQDATAHFQTALQLRPNFPEAENNLGYALLAAGNSAEAMDHFQQAIREKPDYAAAYCNVGNLLKQAGQMREASRQYKKAIQYKPDSFEAHNNLGIVLQQMGNRHEAIGHFQQALRLEPDYPEVHNNLGNALLLVGEAPEAIEHYELALRLKSNYLEAAINLVTAFVRVHQMEQAIEAAQRALSLAQASGQSQQVEKIDSWLRAHRDGLANRQVAPRVN